jgi:hypothetical protein
MKRMLLGCIVLLVGFLAYAETRAPAAFHSAEKLKEMSTLVFTGTVMKIETVEKYKVSFPTEAKVVKVVKGELEKKEISFKHKNPGRCIIIEKEFNTPKVGQEGTFYIQDQGGTLVLIGYIKKTEQIDEVVARKLAIQQYHKLFFDKYYFNPVDKKHHKFPKLDGKFFHKAKLQGGAWQLAGDPPAGVHVYAKVSIDGKWVQLSRVGFAPQ